MKKFKNVMFRLPGWFFSLTLIFSFSNLRAQENNSLTIDDCYLLAKENYPMIKQMAIIEKATEYSIENASKGFLPQIQINGFATYQSEVTAVPAVVQAFTIPPISKDQYKIYGELNQSLTDPFIISKQKDLLRANHDAELEKYEVELYKLKDRINQIYFGILLIDGQLEQVNILRKDIQAGLDKTNAAILNGIALKSSANQLKAELLKADQHEVELKATRRGFVEMLSIFLNKQLAEGVELNMPTIVQVSSTINRPELRMFEAQKKSFEIQDRIINVKNIPRIGLFIQGGYGRPALNMLDDEFNLYYIGGIRLNWNLGGFYTSKNDKQLANLNKNAVDIQKDIFLFNSNLVLAQQQNEIDKFNKLAATDKHIIELRESISNTAKSQLEFGTITVSDYINFVNTTDQAKQNMLLHNIQSLLSKYNYQNTSGN